MLLIRLESVIALTYLIAVSGLTLVLQTR